MAPEDGRLRRGIWNRQALEPTVEAASMPRLIIDGLRDFVASPLIPTAHSPEIVTARMDDADQMAHETYSHL
jgi:hypothetical protein